MTRAHSWDGSLRNPPCFPPSTLTRHAKLSLPGKFSVEHQSTQVCQQFFIYGHLFLLYFLTAWPVLFLEFGSLLWVSSKCNFFHLRKWELHKLPGRFHGTHGRHDSCLGWYTSDCHITSLQSILQNSQTVFSSWVNLQFLVTISISAVETRGNGSKEN